MLWTTLLKCKYKRVVTIPFTSFDSNQQKRKKTELSNYLRMRIEQRASASCRQDHGTKVVKNQMWSAVKFPKSYKWLNFHHAISVTRSTNYWPIQTRFVYVQNWNWDSLFRTFNSAKIALKIFKNNYMQHFFQIV